jgi:hypothetical protein
MKRVLSKHLVFFWNSTIFFNWKKLALKTQPMHLKNIKTQDFSRLLKVDQRRQHMW